MKPTVTVKVRTRPRTMSGYPGGRTLVLEKHEAERWVERRWADRVDPTPQEQLKRAQQTL